MIARPTALVLLPGIEGTGVLFRPLLEALPPDVKPIVASYPGDRPLGYAELLPYVASLIPSDLTTVLLGESFSGPLALMAAASTPSVRGVVLCASFVRCPHGYVPRCAAGLVQPLLFRPYPVFARVRAFLTGRVGRDLHTLLAEALAQVSPVVLAHRLREVIRADVRMALRQCPAPVLYLRGQTDYVVPGTNLREIQHIRPDAKVTRIASGHLVLQTRPAEAAAAIMEFVRHVADPAV